MIALILHLALMLAAAPLLAGLVEWSGARLSGRAGPSPLQPWRDLRRLARKPPIRPEGTSRVFAAAPAASLVPLLVCTALVPSFTLGMATAPLADLVLAGGLLALSRAALCLGLIDGGSGPGGQAGARVIWTAVPAGPALAAVLLTLALLAGGTNIDVVVAALRDARTDLRLPLMLVLAATVLVALDRTGSLPQDGAPAAGSGEWSGRDLALVRAADMLATLLWVSLIVVLLPPHPAPAGIAAPSWSWTSSGWDDGLAPPLSAAQLLFWPLLDWAGGLLGWVIKLAVLGLLLGWLQASLPRVATGRRPALLGLALLLGVLSALLVFLGGNGA